MQFKPLKKQNIVHIGTSTGNFLPKVHDLGLKLGPGVFNVEIQHDSWCSIWATSHCNCNPDFKTKKLAG